MDPEGFYSTMRDQSPVCDLVYGSTQALQNMRLHWSSDLQTVVFTVAALGGPL